jgi:competence protein ComEC
VLSLVMALLFEMTHLPGLAAWLSYRMPTPPWWVAYGFCGAFVLAGLALRFARRAVGAALAACAVFVVLVAVHPFAPRLPQGVLQLTALDCGRGDALFLVLPSGATMLVNAGGGRTRGARKGGLQGRHWDAGEDIVSPYLWSLGIKKVDVVALTSASPDRVGGLYAILANFRVGEFWHAPEPETPAYAELLDAVAERGIPTRTLMAGDALSLGGASVRVLWPGADSASVAAGFSPANTGLKADTMSVSNDNNDSLVLRISAGGMNFLLPENASRDAEKAILAADAPLESHALEVTYCPWSASRDFLGHFAPSVVIIGGVTNVRGLLPTSEKLKVLQNVGARIFRTDTDGATTVEWKERSLLVRTYRGTEMVVPAGDVYPLTCRPASASR